ncbi:protein of unknown function [Nitrospira japonica]|uniref:Uncharacterized protein n=1 Tax=Nitrospira japonica TaxID=1325564 RepID=A0A1W1I1F9_9BACT|nr:hypothetical protein [Nitrospira japonica]SLM46822.1 protein of unknown function [Nitrospira japonica]
MTLIRNVCLVVLCVVLSGLEPHLEQSASANDVGMRVETALREAAKDVDHRHRESTDRAILDITYLIEQSWKAKEHSRDGARKDYAAQARALIVREARMGHLDIVKTGSVLKLLEELLSDQAG